MPISGLTLMKDATGGTTTAGTAITLQDDGVEVKNGRHVGDMGDDFITRTNLTFRTRNPQRNADGTYTKAKRWGTIVVPKVLADGSISYDLVRIEMEVHPETTAAEQVNLEMLAAQFFTDADLASFRRNGSLE